MSDRVRGHFASILRKEGELYIPTTLTSQRKRTGQAKELRKRNELLAELQVEPVAKRLDNIVRRWANVRNHGPDQ
jgi:hypothetical protein